MTSDNCRNGKCLPCGSPPSLQQSWRQPSGHVFRSLRHRGNHTQNHSSSESNQSKLSRNTGSGDSGSSPPQAAAATPYHVHPLFGPACCRSRANNVVLVHGLYNIPVNCDRLFNLFCLYGNVTTVKILRDDKALVELEDVEAARRCVSNLHLLPLDASNKMKVKYSKHSMIHEQLSPLKLADGTPTQKIYLASRLNRFSRKGKSYGLDRRRIAAPSKILHFFNAPTDVCGSVIHKSISKALGRTDAINSIIILPQKPGAKCSTGLIEMNSIGLAVKTILMANHLMIKSTRSRFPFLTKLCFSTWSEIHRPASTTAPVVRLSSTPRNPWMLHNSEHAVPTAEFPVAGTTAVTIAGDGDDGGDNERSSWTLWTIGSEPSRIAAHVETWSLPADTSRATASTTELRPEALAVGTADSDEALIGLLRRRLCAVNSGSQGDVLREPPPGRTGADVDSAVADSAPNRPGPLGDA